MSTVPLYELELRANDERRRLQSAVIELRSRVRDNLDLTENARKHVWLAGGILATLGLLSGYAVAGLFTRY
jgi:hypothetical protein